MMTKNNKNKKNKKNKNRLRLDPGAAAFVRVKHPCHAVLGSFRSDSDGGRAIRVSGHYLIEPWVSGSGKWESDWRSAPRPRR